MRGGLPGPADACAPRACPAAPPRLGSAVRHGNWGSLKMFRGSLVALITPMQADGSLDLKAFAEFVEWQIAEGTQGLIPVGTTGESPTVSHREHHEVV